MIKWLVPSPVRHALRCFVRDFEWKYPSAWSLVGRARVMVGNRPSLGVAHLNNYLEEDALGPLQQDEALFLFALARVVRPKLIVEFGFNKGDSSLNFLKALPRDSVVHSYDIKDSAATIARTFERRYPNFHFHGKSQTEFARADIGGDLVDFVFLDAAHSLELNQTTWRNLEPALADNAIVAVHDTGTWSRQHLRPCHRAFILADPNKWLNNDEYQHQLDERIFINWVLATSPAFSAVHFHSTNVLRHGLTILQRGAKLPTSVADCSSAAKEATLKC